MSGRKRCSVTNPSPYRPLRYLKDCCVLSYKIWWWLIFISNQFYFILFLRQKVVAINCLSEWWVIAGHCGQALFYFRSPWLKWRYNLDNKNVDIRSVYRLSGMGRVSNYIIITYFHNYILHNYILSAAFNQIFDLRIFGADGGGKRHSNNITYECRSLCEKGYN